MKCIYCGGETKVTNKRDIESPELITRRRRECLKCKRRFSTFEKPEKNEIRVIKKDNRRESFSTEKLKKGILMACEKRPVSLEVINKIVGEIEFKLQNQNKKEISSKKIGEMVMKRLKKIDPVAYIRFASIYREFKDLGDFKKEIKDLN